MNAPGWRFLTSDFRPLTFGLWAQPALFVGCMKGTVEIMGSLTEPCIPEEDWEMLRPRDR